MASNYNVAYIDLVSQYESEKEGLEKALIDIAKSGQFILRKEVSDLESRVCDYLGVKYALGVNSGTDALFLSLKAAGIKEGDEVITVSHTFVATISTIVHCGAKPVLVDIKDDGNIDTNKIEEAITNKTKAIMVVHMNGKVCDMDMITALSQKHNLLLFEDAAQAFGATYKNKFAGSFGVCAGFSFHPMKVLGCMGDGGIITTNDEKIYKQLMLLRNHGQETKSDLVLFGYNSRLDNIQAAVLLFRLSKFEEDLQERREVAKYYIKHLSSLPQIKLPILDEDGRRDVCSSFVIQADNRDALKQHLLENGIEVAVHWETPNHKQKKLNLDNFDLHVTQMYSKTILSLPIHPYLTQKQLSFVVEKIEEFYV